MRNLFGESVKNFGFGLMRLPLTDPEDGKSIDIAKTCEMVDFFLERGFTYFDTAWFYHGGESERAAKTCLTARHPRERFTLATKLHEMLLHVPDDRDRVFREQLEKTGAGYFDYYLLHGISESRLARYEAFDCFRWLSEKKEQGYVRHIGCSFHDTADALEKVLDRLGARVRGVAPERRHGALRHELHGAASGKHRCAGRFRRIAR